jgi:hypothetical protein
MIFKYFRRKFWRTRWRFLTVLLLDDQSMFFLNKIAKVFAEKVFAEKVFAEKVKKIAHNGDHL